MVTAAVTGAWTLVWREQNRPELYCLQTYFHNLSAWKRFFYRTVVVSVCPQTINPPTLKKVISVPADIHTDERRKEQGDEDRRKKLDVFAAMDVTVYPPPPQSLAPSDHSRLGQLSYPDPAFGTNKVGKERDEGIYVGYFCYPCRRDERHVCGALFRFLSVSLSIYSSCPANSAAMICSIRLWLSSQLRMNYITSPHWRIHGL